MKNVQLNPGGVIGAVLLFAPAIVIVLLTSSSDHIGSRAGKLGVVGATLGAFGGNYLWDRLFPKRH